MKKIGRMEWALATALAVLCMLHAMTGGAEARNRAGGGGVPQEWKGCIQGSDMRKVVEGCTTIIERGGSVQNLPIAYSNRGLAYDRLGERARATFDYRQAIRYIDEAIRRKPGVALYYGARASAYFGLAEYDNALADTTQAISLKPKAPDDSSMYCNRAVIHNAQKNFTAALSDLNEALRLNPNSVLAYVNRSWIYVRLGRLEQAKADADMAVRVGSGYSEGYWVKGYAELLLGDASAAIGDFTRSVSLGTAFPEAFTGRGLAYEATHNRELALADYHHAVELPAVHADEKEARERARSRIAALEATASVPPAAAAPQPPRVSAALSPAPQPAQLPARPAEASSGKRVALVIGNGGYRNVARLANPAVDAGAVADALRRLGFAQVTELRDVDQRGLLAALKEFGDQAEGADWAVIYYAGHGVEVGGQNYLLPVDAQLLRASHVDDEAVPLDRVLSKTQGARRLKLVILDACRNNPFAPRMAQDTGAGRAVGRGLGRVEPSGGVLVAYAARDGSIADDGSNGGHSPYTQALLDHLDRPGLEISMLFRQVRDAVYSATGGRQEPYTYGSLPGEAMYFRAETR